MTDIEIKIKGKCSFVLEGTKDDTVTFPQSAKISSNKYDTDIEFDANDVNGMTKLIIPEKSEKIELAVDDGSVLILKNLNSERIEVDAKGTVEITIMNIVAALDVNMIGGEATLYVPSDMKVSCKSEGKGNFIETSGIIPSENSDVKIELNGRDSVLKIATR